MNVPPAGPKRRLRRSRRRGRGVELDVIDLLREADYVAYRIPQPAPADVVAIKASHRTMLVQVKSTAGGPYKHFGPVDREALVREARRAGATAVLAWWPPRRATPVWIESQDWPTCPAPLPAPD